MILTDLIDPLIEFYTAVRDTPGELAWATSALAIPGVGPENYYHVRDLEPATPIERAARFFFLNRLCFNGVYRENAKGDYNVPYGDAIHRKSIAGRSSRDAIESLFPNREKIQKVSDALKGSILAAADFEEVIAEAGAGDLVYCDPPYHTTFTAYNKGGFSEADQERLAVSLYHASERGAAIVAHNHDTEKVRWWYEEWTTIVETNEKRSVNSDVTKRNERAPCVLITKGISL
jgi:DNA adenine methylase